LLDEGNFEGDAGRVNFVGDAGRPNFEGEGVRIIIFAGDGDRDDTSRDCGLSTALAPEFSPPLVFAGEDIVDCVLVRAEPETFARTTICGEDTTEEVGLAELPTMLAGDAFAVN